MRLVVLVVITLLTTSCSRVQLVDGEWCGDMGPLGAACFYTVTDQEREIPKKEWDEERFGMICTKAENFAAWKANIEKLCYETRACSKEVKKKVDTFAVKAGRFTSPTSP